MAGDCRSRGKSDHGPPVLPWRKDWGRFSRMCSKEADDQHPGPRDGDGPPTRNILLLEREVLIAVVRRALRSRTNELSLTDDESPSFAWRSRARSRRYTTLKAIVTMPQISVWGDAKGTPQPGRASTWCSRASRSNACSSAWASARPPGLRAVAAGRLPPPLRSCGPHALLESALEGGLRLIADKLGDSGSGSV
jgi:hypothetical protein